MRLFSAAFAAGLMLGAAAAAHPVDLTRLPLGETRLSQAPKAGYFWACRIEQQGGGAMGNGPWIRKDGTFDLTAKQKVGGAASWPHRFTIAVEGGARVLATNDLPNHTTGIFPIVPGDPAFAFDRNPNHIGEQDFRFTLPAEPAQLAQPTCAPGAVGILLTGVALFSGLDAQSRDAVAHEVQDACQGHPQITAAYHYHNVTSCIDDQRLPGGHSMLVGYAIDGFGIFGNHGEKGEPLASADLDECHGHTHAIPWDGKTVTMYHYHATPDFPYTVGCMRGAYTMRTMIMISGGLSRTPDRRGPPGPGGRGGPPDFVAAAAKLGLSPEALVDALGPPPPDFPAAAKRLGIPAEALMDALGVPPGAPARRPRP